MTQRIVVGLLAAMLMAVTVWVDRQYQMVAGNSLTAKLSQIVPVRNEPVVDCAAIASQRPLVLLALGQSNAGNHGQHARTNQLPVLLMVGGKCLWATDPLPGSTGTSGSIWSRLPAQLAAMGLRRPVLLSVIGLEATSIGDWTDASSPLHQRLRTQLKTMQALGLAPHAVLWQQGEADARLGTTRQAYQIGVQKLAQAVIKHAPTAHIFIAYSTLCRSAPNVAIRSAVRQLIGEGGLYQPGPDTDTLAEPAMRFDGCHLSEKGLNAASVLWAETLYSAFASIRPDKSIGGFHELSLQTNQ